MKYEELTERMQKQIDELKQYAQTIQSDVLDALESAKTLEEFRSPVDSSMEIIIRSTEGVRSPRHREEKHSLWLRKIFHQFSKGQARCQKLG